MELQFCQLVHSLEKRCVKLEQDNALLQSMFTDPANLPPEAAQRLRSMEQANAVLHANLAAARGALKTMVERPLC